MRTALRRPAHPPRRRRRHRAADLRDRRHEPTGAAAQSRRTPECPRTPAGPTEEPPLSGHDYITDGAEIYRRSFATIRAEADLSGLPPGMADVAVRMIHACGQVDLPADIAASHHLVDGARRALKAGAPILCDAMMVASGVTAARLPADNEVLCLLRDPRVPELAKEIGNTRSAAAFELLTDRFEGAVLAIGNAPTALFHVLDLIDRGAPRPAAILGIPVGFVGAVESKQALAARTDLEYLVVHGRRGGSAITAAALNALAHEQEIIA